MGSGPAYYGIVRPREPGGPPGPPELASLQLTTRSPRTRGTRRAANLGSGMGRKVIILQQLCLIWIIPNASPSISDR
jgi:hypothetical protein